jgi:outer membrane cobalamin receptor
MRVMQAIDFSRRGRILADGHPALSHARFTMKHRLPTALLAALALAVAVPATVMAQEREEIEETGRAAARKKPDDRFCIRETGSRIVATRSRSKKNDEECVNASGRVYTREEIERTGSVDMRDALRRLDPSIF